MKLCPTCKQCYEDFETSCSQACHSPLVLKRAGTRLINNKYRLDALLGHGGMGAVYRCTHLELNHPKAIKLLLPDYAGADPHGRQRLRREGLTACLSNHPNLVRVHDCGTNVVAVDDEHGARSYDELYVVMELLDGQTLREHLSRVGRLSVRQSLEIARQVASGLAELHSKGVVYRDLKPANIMLTRDHAGDLLVKVVDFGAVKFIRTDSAPDDADLTGALMLGSPRYTSPENCRGEPLDERSDIYCLGLVLYEMLAGRHPFSSKDIADLIYQHAYVPAPPLDEVCQGLPSPLVRLVMSSLEKHPERRPQSAAEFIRALLELEASGSDFQASGYVQTSSNGPEPEAVDAPLDSDEETRVSGSFPAGRVGEEDGVAASVRQEVSTGRVSLPAASRREARHATLALIYLAAFIAAAAFFTWSFLSKGPATVGAASAPVERVPAAELNRGVGDELIATTDINIRNEPSLKGEKVGLAAKGSHVRVISRSGNWCEVVVLEHERGTDVGESVDRGWLDGALLRSPKE